TSSVRPTVTAWTLMSTSEGPTVGSGQSRYSSTSGPPNLRITTAFTCSPSLLPSPLEGEGAPKGRERGEDPTRTLPPRGGGCPKGGRGGKTLPLSKSALGAHRLAGLDLRSRPGAAQGQHRHVVALLARH